MQLSWDIKHFNELSVPELYALMQLRLEVFSVEQNCPYQDADGKDQHSWHVMGYGEGGKLLAYARVLPPGISYTEVSIGRIVTSKIVRGSGAGRELMRKCFAFISQQFGKVPVRISAQAYLRKFYSDFGFGVVGEEYIEDHIPHVEMLLDPSSL